jgi:isoleucyl-tRNA synthetase
MDAARLFAPFVSDLSTWYIRRSRDRIKNGDMQAIATLYYVLTEVTRLIALFFPFLSEQFFDILGMRELAGVPSVHMDLFSKAVELGDTEKKKLKVMADTRNLVSLALSIRVSSGLKVRQPLSELVVVSKKGLSSAEDLVSELVLDEVNVKKIKLVVAEVQPEFESNAKFKRAENDDFVVFLNSEVPEELRLEGLARELVRKLQDIRKESGFNVIDRVKVVLPETEENKLLVEKFGNDLKQKVLADSIELGGELAVTKIY